MAQWNPQQPGQSSQIIVDGNATLAHGALVNLAAGGSSMRIYKPGTRYTLLTANQGLSGTYTLLGNTSLSAVLSLAPFYDAHHFYLTVTQQRLLPALAQTANQRAALAGVQSLAATPASAAMGPSVSMRATDVLPVLSTPFALLTNLQSDAQVRYAADQLSGEIYASVKNTFLEDSRYLRDAVAMRLSQAGSDQQSPDASAKQSVRTQASGLATWGQFVGSWARRDGSGNDASVSSTLGGFLLGADKAVGSHSRIGVMSGYTQTSANVARRGSRLSSNDVHLGIYAGTQLGALDVNLGAAYTRHDFRADRSIVFANYAGNAHGKGKADTAQVFGEAAYRLQFKSFALEPFARGAYVRLNTRGLQEQGGPMALSVGGDRQAVTYSTLGTRASTHFQFQGDAFDAYTSLGWRHAFGRVRPDAQMAFAHGAPFTVAGLPIARNALAVDTGGRYVCTSKPPSTWLTTGSSHSRRWIAASRLNSTGSSSRCECAVSPRI
nr:autotransporter domain-containing protein [Dyella acidiphila]